MREIWTLLGLLGIGGCAGIPDGIEAVKGFDVNRYLGKWYEIARFDHSFERGLTNVSATYSLREGGGVDVLNRGFDAEDGEWQTAKGKAYFVAEPELARLEVTFFWPFYGGYNVFDLDKDYAWSLVCGNDRSYLWILARARKLPEELLKQLLDKAKALGFDVSKLIFVAQDREDA